ncbi:MAG: BspA family leucine-rich repeat surface protein [Lacticaseibacillus songhuajiangensis]|nr:BspA family leucine-rich repeat surface protein [Lacticaseibacillus songhuajiangensis]
METINRHERRLRAEATKKVHYRMYKSGKQWVFAGVAVLTLGTAIFVNNQSVASASDEGSTTAEQLTNEAKNSSESSASGTADAQNTTGQSTTETENTTPAIAANNTEKSSATGTTTIQPATTEKSGTTAATSSSTDTEKVADDTKNATSTTVEQQTSSTTSDADNSTVSSVNATKNSANTDDTNVNTTKIENESDLASAKSAAEADNAATGRAQKIVMASPTTAGDKTDWSIDASGVLTLGATYVNAGDGWAQWTDSNNITSIVADKGAKITGNASNLFGRLSTVTSIDLSNVDTTGVTNLNSTFEQDSNVKTINLQGWDTSAVTSFTNMFYQDSALQSVDVSGFDTSSATSFDGMFFGAGNLENIDVSGFDTSQATTTANMFGWDSKLQSLDLSNWDMSKVTDASNMLNATAKLWKLQLGSKTKLTGSNLAAAPAWSTPFPANSSVLSTTTDWQYVDGGTDYAPTGAKITATDLMSTYDSSGTATAATVVWGGSDVATTDPTTTDPTTTDPGTTTPTATEDSSDWSINNGVLTLGANFVNAGDGSVAPWAGQSGITSVVAEAGAKLTGNASGLFSVLSSAKTIDLSNLDTSAVTNMSNLFANDTSATSINMSGWNTSKVTDFSSMFINVQSAPSLDVSGFDTSSATTLAQMFYGDNALQNVDVSKFDTSNVLNTSQMFFWDSSLLTLDLSNWDMSKVTNTSDMFTATGKLWKVQVGSKTKLAGSNFQAAPSGNTPFPSDASYTSRTTNWQYVSDGTDYAPTGSKVSAASLMATYDGGGNALAGTLVWGVPAVYQINVQFVSAKTGEVVSGLDAGKTWTQITYQGDEGTVLNPTTSSSIRKWISELQVTSDELYYEYAGWHVATGEELGTYVQLGAITYAANVPTVKVYVAEPQNVYVQYLDIYTGQVVSGTDASDVNYDYVHANNSAFAESRFLGRTVGEQIDVSENATLIKHAIPLLGNDETGPYHYSTPAELGDKTQPTTVTVTYASPQTKITVWVTPQNATRVVNYVDVATGKQLNISYNGEVSDAFDVTAPIGSTIDSGVGTSYVNSISYIDSTIPYHYATGAELGDYKQTTSYVMAYDMAPLTVYVAQDASTLPDESQNTTQLTVKYVNGQGETIKTDTTQSGKAGEAFTVDAPVIAGYKLVDSKQQSITGTYQGNQMTLTLTYESVISRGKVSVSRTIHYVFADGSKAAEDQVQWMEYQTLTDEGAGKTVYTPKGFFVAQDSPVISGFTPDKTTIAQATGTASMTAPTNAADITVTYTADTQKAKVNYVDKTTGKTLSSTDLSGASNSAMDLTAVQAKIVAYVSAGYTVTTDPTKGGLTFDDNSAQDQEYNVELSETIVGPTTPTNADDPDYAATHKSFHVTTTVDKPDKLTADVTPSNGKQDIAYTRTVTTNKVTGVKTYGNWQLAGTDFSTISPVQVAGYTVSPDSITAATIGLTAFANSADATDGSYAGKFTYTATGSDHEITYGTYSTTRTVHFVDEAGKTLKPDVVQTLNYKTVTDTNTGTTIYTPVGEYAELTSPSIEDYTASVATVPAVKVNASTVKPDNSQYTVIYSSDPITYGTVTTTRTIHFVDGDGKTLKPDLVQTLIVHTATNTVTGKTVYVPDGPYAAVTTPTLEGYTPSVTEVPAQSIATGYNTPTSTEYTVTYTADGVSHGTYSTTRTIHYTYADGSKAAQDVVQTLTYKTTTDLKTGRTIYTPTGVYASKASPELQGYTADQKVIAAEAKGATDIQPGSEAVTVVYSKNTTDNIGTTIVTPNDGGDGNETTTPSDDGQGLPDTYSGDGDATDNVTTPGIKETASKTSISNGASVTTRAASAQQGLPQTGDNDGKTMSFIGLALASVLGLLGLGVKRRRED